MKKTKENNVTIFMKRGLDVAKKIVKIFDDARFSNVDCISVLDHLKNMYLSQDVANVLLFIEYKKWKKKEPKKTEAEKK